MKSWNIIFCGDIWMKLIGIYNVKCKKLEIFSKLGQCMRPTTIVRVIRIKMIDFYCLWMKSFLSIVGQHITFSWVGGSDKHINLSIRAARNIENPNIIIFKSMIECQSQKVNPKMRHKYDGIVCSFLTPRIINISAHGDIQDCDYKWINPNFNIFHLHRYDCCSIRIHQGIWYWH